MVNLIRQSGARIEGAGIVIEKTYMNARRAFEAEGIRIHSLANIVDIIGNEVIVGKSI
jgi:xanthine phosphoribosyltransferase